MRKSIIVAVAFCISACTQTHSQMHPSGMSCEAKCDGCDKCYLSCTRTGEHGNTKTTDVKAPGVVLPIRLKPK